MAFTANIIESLNNAIEERDLTIEELVTHASDLLQQIAPQQTRYKVSERPDVRTIRYYINRKLLPRPEGYRGGKARYSGSHLLRLLVIKKLQAGHQTLRQISRILEQSSDAQLQELLAGTRGLSPLSETPLSIPEVGLSPSDPSPSDPSETLELASGAIRRVQLPGGANIDLPEGALASSEIRIKLAQRLETLAQELRTDPGTRKSEREGE